MSVFAEEGHETPAEAAQRGDTEPGFLVYHLGRTR